MNYAVILKSDFSILGRLPGLPARWQSGEREWVHFSEGGLETDDLVCWPVVEANPEPPPRHVRAGHNDTVAPIDSQVVRTIVWIYQPPSSDEVRAECSRRMRLLTGARDDQHLQQILTNGMREAVRLQNKLLAGGEWSEQEAARAAYLKGVDAAIEGLRAASNLLEPSPPDDFAADAHWPSGGG